VISVVIPTFRRQNRLRVLLGSLANQQVTTPFEVLVIANLPEAGLKKVVESFGPNFRFHETGRLGVNIARNKGLERARGEIVVFLDDDMFVTDHGYLQKILTAHARHPEALAIGGGYSPKADMTTVEAAYHWILEHTLRASVGERDEARVLRGGNVSFKASGLDGKHRFDDRIVFGESELSFFARLRREQNLFLLIDSLSVEHRTQVSLFEIARRGFYRGYGQGLAEFETPPERPHWNSQLPLEETFRRAHVEQTLLFKLAVRVYKRFNAYGYKLGLKDSDAYQASLNSNKAVYRRPDFSPTKIIAAFFGGRWRKSALQAWSEQMTALSAALSSRLNSR
jgi:glycosyltransferase involved in cell wall biosynthesis